MFVQERARSSAPTAHDDQRSHVMDVKQYAIQELDKLKKSTANFSTATKEQRKKADDLIATVGEIADHEELQAHEDGYGALTVGAKRARDRRARDAAERSAMNDTIRGTVG